MIAKHIPKTIKILSNNNNICPEIFFCGIVWVHVKYIKINPSLAGFETYSYRNTECKHMLCASICIAFTCGLHLIVRGSIVGTEFLHSSAKSAGFQQFRWQEREGEEVLVDGGWR